MPIITPKSPEILQAQAAAFACEYAGYGDGQDLVQEIGNSSVGMEISFDTPPSQREFVVSSREKEYVEFLREAGGQSSDLVQHRSQLLERYADFAPAIEALQADIAGTKLKEWRSHPQYMSEGKTCAGFRIEHEGRDYALRMPFNGGVGIDREYVMPGLKAAGETSLEQIVAVSYEDGVTVAEIMMGRNIAEIAPEEIAKIPDEHIARLVDTVLFVQKSGLLLDSKPGNVFYDSRQGFGFIDLVGKRYGGENVPGGNDIASAVSEAGAALLFPIIKKENDIYDAEGSELQTNQALKELYDLSAPLLKRYRAACLVAITDYPSIDQEMAEQRLDVALEVLENRRQEVARLLEEDTQDPGLETAQAA